MNIKKVNNTIDGEHKSFEKLPSIDNKKILSEGKNDAVLDLKVSNDNLPPAINELRLKLHEYKTTIYFQAQKYFNVADNAIKNHEPNHDINVIRTHVSTATIESEDLDLHEEESSLTSDFQTFETQRDNYYEFKKINSLSQLPKNSDPLETKFQIYALVALILVEVLINFFMLRGGGRTDFQATLSISIAQVTFNIGSCYLLGKVLLGHILHANSQVKKISNSILFLVHVYSIFLVNINMGIYRQNIANGGDAFDTTKKALGNLRDNFDWTPFPPQISLDAMSVIAIGVGLVFAFLAYWDGFKSDDSFPGYGHVYRGALKIKRKIGARLRKINMNWNDYLKKSNAEQKRFVQTGLNSINGWSTEVNTIEQIWVDYRKILFTLENTYQNAVDLYVSNYNKFHEKNVLNLKVKLFDEVEFDLRKQFSDIVDNYMHDNDRLAEEKEKAAKFSKEIKILQAEISEQNKKDTDFIIKLSKDFACPLK